MSDFSNYPTSIGAARAKKSGNAGDWSPRDVLIHVLRKIDEENWNPAALVVVLRCEDDAAPGVATRYFASCPDIHVMRGMLAQAQFEIPT